MIKLLHIEKNIPEYVLKTVLSIEQRINTDNIKFSRHIQEHFANPNMKHDYTSAGLMECIESLKTNPVKPFEIEVSQENGRVFLTKYVVRVPYDKKYDISIAIRGNMVVTAWLNRHDDTHKTLDLSKYADGI